MTQDRLAAAGGVQRRAQANYEAGERAPDAGYLAAVAASGVDVLFVLTGRRYEAASPVSPDTTQAGATKPGGVSSSLVRRQTVSDRLQYPGQRGGAVLLSAAVDGEIREYQVIEHITERVCAGKSASSGSATSSAGAARTAAGPIAFERGYMAAAMGRSDDGFLSLTVEGDSMSPTLHHGELVVIDTTVQRVNVSGVYVVRFDGDLTIKRILKKSDGSLVISSDNAQYSRGDEVFTRDQAATLSVIGRMVWPRAR